MPQTTAFKNTDKNGAENIFRAVILLFGRDYFFIAATCFATSSERSSLFFSRPSPIS